MNRFIVKCLTYYPIIIRSASVCPDSGVCTLRVIAPYIFINPQRYSFVTFKKKLIFVSFVALMMHYLMYCLWKTNTARNLVSRERYIAIISRTTFKCNNVNSERMRCSAVRSKQQCYLVSWLEHVLCVQEKSCKFFPPLSVITQVINLLNGITYFLTKLAKISVHWSLTIIILSFVSYA